ncbi:MAG: hypothetical protein IJL26_09380 [Clostridia bacterium]|nr:hypothetical protein [Clostridia bacterium]
MKKKLVFFLALLSLCDAALCGCGVFSAEPRPTTEPPRETSADTQSSAQTTAVPEQSAEPSADTAPETSGAQNESETTRMPIDGNSVYDGVDLDGLWDSELAPADELEELLCDFQEIDPGSAGASMRIAARELSFLRLAQKEPSVVRERLNGYLDGLTPVQADYYSYNVSYIYDALRKDMEYHDGFSWLTDLTGEDPGEVGLPAIESLMQTFTDAFDAHGVKYEWKTYDISPLID